MSENAAAREKPDFQALAGRIIENGDREAVVVLLTQLEHLTRQNDGLSELLPMLRAAFTDGYLTAKRFEDAVEGWEASDYPAKVRSLRNTLG